MTPLRQGMLYVLNVVAIRRPPSATISAPSASCPAFSLLAGTTGSRAHARYPR